MNKYLTISASTVLLFAGLFSITGCSSSDDGGGGTLPATLPATVPANAVEITAANAEGIVAASITTVNSFESAFQTISAVETTPVIGLNSVLDIVLPLIKDGFNNSGIDPVTGAVYSDSGDCPYGGTYSESGDEVYNPPNWSDTFTITLTNCDLYDFIVDGTLSATLTENEDTGEYSNEVSGSLTIILAYDNTGKISFTGIDYQESGNWTTYTYTITHSTYAIDFVVDGISSGGFLAELKASIVESSGDFDNCPESGHIFITGANSTTAEGLYNGDGTMTIKANGTVVNATASCYL